MSEPAETGYHRRERAAEERLVRWNWLVSLLRPRRSPLMDEIERRKAGNKDD